VNCGLPRTSHRPLGISLAGESDDDEPVRPAEPGERGRCDSIGGRGRCKVEALIEAAWPTSQLERAKTFGVPFLDIGCGCVCHTTRFLCNESLIAARSAASMTDVIEQRGRHRSESHDCGASATRSTEPGYIEAAATPPAAPAGAVCDLWSILSRERGKLSKERWSALKSNRSRIRGHRSLRNQPPPPAACSSSCFRKAAPTGARPPGVRSSPRQDDDTTLSRPGRVALWTVVRKPMEVESTQIARK